MGFIVLLLSSVVFIALMMNKLIKLRLLKILSFICFVGFILAVVYVEAIYSKSNVHSSESIEEISNEFVSSLASKKPIKIKTMEVGERLFISNEVFTESTIYIQIEKIASAKNMTISTYSLPSYYAGHSIVGMEVNWQDVDEENIAIQDSVNPLTPITIMKLGTGFTSNVTHEKEVDTKQTKKQFAFHLTVPKDTKVTVEKGIQVIE